MENRTSSWALIGLGLTLAVGMAAAAFILGGQFKTLGAARQSIVVKGLAEKPVQADLAEWSVGVEVRGERFGEALEKLRQSRPLVDAFLSQYGFEPAELTEENVRVEPRMVEEFSPQGHSRPVQRGFTGSQRIVVRTKKLDQVIAAHKAILQLVAEGKPVVYGAPNYLLSELENIKMSLIGAATQNARQRAEEFAKVGGAQVGPMRSAAQGAFYILPANADSDASDYGGIYDKSTVEKQARVVVTIDYEIK